MNHQQIHTAVTTRKLSLCNTTSHTLSWKRKKFVPQKIASRMNTKNDIFQKYKEQNQKLSTPMKCQHTHNSLTTQKSVAVHFNDVKTEEKVSSQHGPGK